MGKKNVGFRIIYKQDGANHFVWKTTHEGAMRLAKSLVEDEKATEAFVDPFPTTIEQHAEALRERIRNEQQNAATNTELRTG